jgi:transposase-like protein
MGKRGHSEEEILRVLREAESGDDTVVEICRKMGSASSRFTCGRRSMRDLDCRNCASCGSCVMRTRS